MKKSGVEFKSIHEIDLNSLDVHQYGGCSKTYISQDKSDIFKEYRDRIPTNLREHILRNIVELHNNSNLIDGNDLILPKTLYLDDKGILQVQQMDYVYGICGINTMRRLYMTKKYYLIIIRLINIIKKYTAKGFVIEDLKLSNVIFDQNINPSIIDNDFTSIGEISYEDNIKTGVFIDEYLKRFNDSLQPDFNIFNLYFMVAMLLLDENEFKYAFSINKFPNIDNLVAINYFIQKNNGIPQNFKEELKNIFSAKRELQFKEDVKYDIGEYIQKRVNNGFHY